MNRTWIPNLITLGNLAAGFISVLFTLHAQFEIAALVILIACVLDGLDGRIARWLGASNPMGAELDSLADVISFGVAPGFLLYALDLRNLGLLGALLSVLYVLSAAFRLARFNLGTIPGYFVGLPSTVAGGITASFVLYGAKLQTPFYPLLSLLLAVLMVSQLPYRDFKRIHWSELRLSKLFLAVTLASIFALINPRKLIFLPLTIYLLYGPKDHLMAAHKKVDRSTEMTGQTRS